VVFTEICNMKDLNGSWYKTESPPAAGTQSVELIRSEAVAYLQFHYNRGGGGFKSKLTTRTCQKMYSYFPSDP